MALTKVQADGINLADTFAFSGTVSGTNTYVPLLNVDNISNVASYHIDNTYINDSFDYYLISGFLKPASDGVYLYQRMYTSGCFDIFHQVHINKLKKTKALCDYLIVGVSTDELIEKSKGRPPLIPFEERISILESNRYVDEVIPQVDKNKQRVVDEYNIDAISVGSDWKGKYPSVTCDMVYFDYTPNVSSTVLKRKL